MSKIYIERAPIGIGNNIIAYTLSENFPETWVKETYKKPRMSAINQQSRSYPSSEKNKMKLYLLVLLLVFVAGFFTSTNAELAGN